MLFGTAGAPSSAKKNSSEAGLERLALLGLGCLELEFVHGARMGRETAQRVRETASGAKILLSAHGPYYVNLNSNEEEKLIASRERLLHAAEIASWCGATDLVFHAAFYQKQDPAVVYEKVRRECAGLLEILREKAVSITLRPETTGKASQFGSLEEILALSAEVDGISPCLDFAHLHAREGKNNTREEWAAILARIEEVLGRGAVENLHIHLAGIAYGAAGEKKHLNAEESDLDYRGLFEVLAGYGAGGRVICESPNLEEDALLYQKTYQAVT